MIPIPLAEKIECQTQHLSLIMQGQGQGVLFNIPL